MKDDFLTKQRIIERGWTRVAIARFLGDPDRTRPNPNYGGAAPVCLYNSVRVEIVENSEAWQQWYSASRVRSKAAVKASKAKAVALRKLVSEWEPGVPRIPLNKVRRKAIEAYNEWNETGSVGKSSDSHFLARIMVNFLRHETTDYDDMLHQVTGKVGVREAQRIVRNRVYDAIVKTYPELADEVGSQRGRR